MLAGLLVDRSARATNPSSATIWIAAASLALGLAVGARPNYVLGLPLLLLPAFRLWKNLPPTRRWSSAALPFAAAAILPAALVGAGLAYYNYLRFGHLAEFGIQYSLSTVNQSTMKLIGFEFYPKNLRLYLHHAADFIRYFPFFRAADRPFGILPRLTLAGCAIFSLSVGSAYDFVTTMRGSLAASSGLAPPSPTSPSSASFSAAKIATSSISPRPRWSSPVPCSAPASTPRGTGHSPPDYLLKPSSPPSRFGPWSTAPASPFPDALRLPCSP
jgi:hypothetical protein